MADIKEDPTAARGVEIKTDFTHVEHIEHVIKHPEEPSETEKFPTLPQYHRSPPSFHKSKSLTAAEINMEVMSDEEVTAVRQRLKNEEPPMSLEEARERRASITQQRKDSINLIRKRTASRTSTKNARPALEDISKGEKNA